MTPDERALARARTWGLLGQLILRGPTDGMLSTLAMLPALSEHLEDEDADTRAAAHYRVLGRSVPPYASVFRGQEAQLGGRWATEARRALDELGFVGHVRGIEPDHLGVLCLGMAHVGEAQWEALQDGQADVAQALAALETRFLSAQILPWLPCVVVAIQRTGHPLYVAVSDLLVDLVVSYELEAAVSASIPGPSMDDWGLNELLACLLTPARSGWWLSPEALEAWARRTELPSGFGTRPQRLRHLLRGAGRLAGLAPLREVAGAEVRQWREAYAQLGQRGLQVEPWLQQLSIAAAWVEGMGVA